MTVKNFLYTNLIQQFKPLFLKIRCCNGVFSIKLTCCNGVDKWRLFMNGIYIPYKLSPNHIIYLDYFKKKLNKNLYNKELLFVCCQNKIILSIQDTNILDQNANPILDQNGNYII